MSKPYIRETNGLRMDFHGIDTVHAPDDLPAGKFPYAANVRRYLRGRVGGRSMEDSSVLVLNQVPHSIRRLNDTTPAGPAGGYILVEGAGTILYANAVQVDSGLSGNPISLVPFRPNQSVQPWMYVGDSIKMDKVRSDTTCYKMGIQEPQIAPIVTTVPASDKVSLVGPVTVTYWGDSPHSGPTGNYIWKNTSDPTGAGPVRVNSPPPFQSSPSGVTTGNSLLFDVITGSPSTPMEWTLYTEYLGTVSTNGTSVTWTSGQQFNGLVAGNQLVISGVTYTIAAAPPPTNTTLALTTSAGVQTAVTYEAAAQSGTTPVFQPALESEGYGDFNFVVQATLYIPTAGTYTLSFNSKDETLWGIGNNGIGTATWAGPTGGQVLAITGQTKTALGGLPLIPKTNTPDGAGLTCVGNQAITFSAAGNYPIEFNYDYWYHSGRTLTVKCNGADLPPIPQAVITQSQYRYTYRSSATGATSNPSPESPESPLSVLANNVTATPSTDPQVDKIDFYRLDAALENFTYVGTVSNHFAITTTLQAVTTTGSPVGVQLTSGLGITVGSSVIFDLGGVNQEIVVVTGIFPPVKSGFTYNPGGIIATFTKTHLIGVQVEALSTTFNDNLLDTDIAANPTLDFDNFEPFPSIDLPKSGTVSVTAGVVNWVSGDRFNVRWLPGTIIVIGTTAFTLNTRPTSATSLTASNVESIGGIEQIVLPADALNTSYNIAEPILAAQPLPYLWGPTDNVSFFFGVGDPLRPGTLYWSKGNNPDSAPDTNQQDVTSPSEPLMNGVIVNGIGLVMSSERGFLIYPNFFNALATAQGTVGATWTIQESISNRGLYMPRAICVDGGGNVFFRGKDGIYISPGGQGSQSITDDDLFNIFPHEGLKPSNVTIGGFTVYPPSDLYPQAQKLNVANGYLYYDYIDLFQNTRTLVYDIAAGGWVVDIYQWPAVVHVLEEGSNINGVLLGCTDSSVRPLTDSGLENCKSVVLVPSNNAGDTRAYKHWSDVWIEAE
jgi:hypothetical protein